MALIRAVSTDSMYIARKRSIKVPISLTLLRGKRAIKEALLDSGATECFVHPRTVKELKLPTTKLTKTRKVRNVDGTLNKAGAITQAVTLTTQYGLSIARH